MEKATRGVRDGQTIWVGAGETFWYEVAWVEVLDTSYLCSPAAVGANATHRVLHVRPAPEVPQSPPAEAEVTGGHEDGETTEKASREGGGRIVVAGASDVQTRDIAWEAERAAWRRARYAHTMVSRAGVEDGDTERSTTHTLYMQNAALLHGRWLLLPESSGSFANVSCYSRHGCIPGEHSTRMHFPHEEELDELCERERPRSLTEDLVMVLGGPWEFTNCDFMCRDGTAVAICESDANVRMAGCCVGAAGFVGRWSVLRVCVCWCTCVWCLLVCATWVSVQESCVCGRFASNFVCRCCVRPLLFADAVCGVRIGVCSWESEVPASCFCNAVV